MRTEPLHFMCCLSSRFYRLVEASAAWSSTHLYHRFIVGSGINAMVTPTRFTVEWSSSNNLSQTNTFIILSAYLLSHTFIVIDMRVPLVSDCVCTSVCVFDVFFPTKLYFLTHFSKKNELLFPLFVLPVVHTKKLFIHCPCGEHER